MRKVIPLIASLVVAIALWLTLRNNMSSSDSVPYQGQQIKLTKSYSDFDDYKNDPNNLDPGEVSKVQGLVKSSPIAKQFPNREQMVLAVFALKFPGYGLSTFGEKPQSDGSVLTLFSVEIPKSGKSRHLAFRGNDGKYSLIDDFLYSDSAEIGGVSIVGEKLVYSTMQGAQVTERSPWVK